LRRIIDNDFLTLLIRVFLGGLFVYASFYKIIHPGDFAKSIWYYHMVPGAFINFIALIMPWWELIAGLCLIFGILYRGAVWSIFIMLVIFAVALLSAWMRGLDIQCGCFKAATGAGDEALNTLLRDLGMIVLVLWLLASKSRGFRLIPARKS
jgi:uncharacterized membrane protein YphA (DoxX/SURF4 family)